MKLASVILVLALYCGCALADDKPVKSTSGSSLSSNELLLPANYHDWVAISPSTPGIPSHRHQHVASKLFVEPRSYEQFTKSGQWPNRTVIVLEIHGEKTATTNSKNNVMGLEVAVKDDRRFPDPWNYYGIVYDQPQIAKKVAAEETQCGTNAKPLDMMLAMAYPTLRAVINAKPSTMSPSLF